MSDRPTRTCPECGKSYSLPPAISRKDNRTEICPRCGQIEAYLAAGISRQRAEQLADEVQAKIEEYQKSSH